MDRDPAGVLDRWHALHYHHNNNYYRCFTVSAIVNNNIYSPRCSERRRRREEEGKRGKGKTRERRNAGKELLKTDRKRNGHEAPRNLESPPLLNHKFLLLSHSPFPRRDNKPLLAQAPSGPSMCSCPCPDCPVHWLPAQLRCPESALQAEGSEAQ